jgi:hypothetical protein
MGFGLMRDAVMGTSRAQEGECQRILEDKCMGRGYKN